MTGMDLRWHVSGISQNSVNCSRSVTWGICGHSSWLKSRVPGWWFPMYLVRLHIVSPCFGSVVLMDNPLIVTLCDDGSNNFLVEKNRPRHEFVLHFLAQICCQIEERQSCVSIPWALEAMKRANNKAWEGSAFRIKQFNPPIDTMGLLQCFGWPSLLNRLHCLLTLLSDCYAIAATPHDAKLFLPKEDPWLWPCVAMGQTVSLRKTHYRTCGCFSFSLHWMISNVLATWQCSSMITKPATGFCFHSWKLRWWTKSKVTPLLSLSCFMLGDFLNDAISL